MRAVTKGILPSTENVKIDVGDEDITFTTSDRQSQIIASCPSSKIKTKGTTCVNAKKVNELLDFYQIKKTLIFLDGNKLKIKTTRRKLVFNFPSEDFPVFTVNNEDTTQVSITSQSLTDLISRTLISMPKAVALIRSLWTGFCLSFQTMRCLPQLTMDIEYRLQKKKHLRKMIRLPLVSSQEGQ